MSRQGRMHWREASPCAQAAVEIQARLQNRPSRRQLPPRVECSLVFPRRIGAPALSPNLAHAPLRRSSRAGHLRVWPGQRAEREDAGYL